MNLSHAVALVLAQLFERRCELQGLNELGIERAGSAVSPAVREGLQPVTVAELEALLAKVARVAAAVGISGEESQGGGPKGNHGRRRLPLGHVRALLSRAKANTWEVRSLHGLASAVLKALGLPDKELPAEADAADATEAEEARQAVGAQRGQEQQVDPQQLSREVQQPSSKL